MPNQYKNKVIYGDSVLMDITDTTAEAGDVAAGDVFYAKSGARTVGTAKYASSQSVGGPADKTISIPIGKVDSTSTSTAFTATIEGITELRDGVCVMLTNGVVTSAEGCTLNINDLGAKRIYNSMAATTAVTTTFNKNYTMLFIYNSTRVTGGCWDMYYGYNANTTYTNASLGQGYATCTTAEATTAKVATLSSYALTTGGYVAVKFSYAVPANATLNVNSKGAKAMYYRGAAITDGIIKANDVAVFIYSTYYHLVAIDRWGVDLASCATTQYVNDAIANVNAFNVSVVQSLPTTDIDTHTIYFISNSGSGTNVYDEYMYINNAWEKIGTTDIDLTGYATEQYVDNAIVQSDWNETDSTDPSYILNKPTIDTSLSESSENPVQNSTITVALGDKQNSAIYGSANTGNSNFITPYMVAVYTAGDDHRDVIVTYTDPTYGVLEFSSWSIASSFSTIASSIIINYNGLLCVTLAGTTSSPSVNNWGFNVYPIQDALTFDSTPTNNSTNPVTSGGVYTALSNKANNADIPSASSTTPIVDGTAAVGSSTAYARADHVHPKITQTISISNNVITLTGSDGSTSSVTLPVYNGTVTSGGGS